MMAVSKIFYNQVTRQPSFITLDDITIPKIKEEVIELLIANGKSPSDYVRDEEKSNYRK